MEKHRNRYLTIITVVGIFLTAGLSILGSMRLKKPVPVKTDFASEAKTEIPVEDEKVEILSPDGKYTLTVKKGGVSNGIITQTFYISSETDKNLLKIYEKDSPLENKISVPVNTFSPDNKYIFLKFEDPLKTHHIVLRTDGKEIKQGSQTVEIESLFDEKYPDFVITDVTGWGSYSLIVINTNTIDGKTGPSFWFDLSNFSFIRLSTRFN